MALMARHQVLVEIKGGNVQNILTSGEIEVTVIDWDNIHENYDYVEAIYQDLDKFEDSHSTHIRDRVKQIKDFLVDIWTQLKEEDNDDD